jgi:hypothetical protein
MFKKKEKEKLTFLKKKKKKEMLKLLKKMRLKNMQGSPFTKIRPKHLLQSLHLLN